jgi:DNA-binding MarR family transcriptional regulator
MADNTQKFIKLAEASLKDFIDRSKDPILRFFSVSPQHWMMLHKVVISYYKNETISKSQLLKFIERSYVTSHSYINTTIKKGYFKILKNNKDKRSIFILPTEQTLKSFENFILLREKIYKL